jgi:hypothetical protein
MSRIISAPVNAAFVILLAVAVSPVFLVDIPAMPDFVNHLARMHIIATAGTPEANPFYEVQWGPSPNLAMDLIVPTIGRLIGVDAASKAFIVVSQLVVVTGAIAIERVIKKRHELSGFAALVLLYSLPFAWGFMNFQFGLGSALWAIAAWMASTEKGFIHRLIIHTLFAVLLYTLHFFALGIYGAVIGLYELWLINQQRDARKAIVTFAILANPVVLLLIALGISTGSGYASEWNLLWKLHSVFRAMSGFSVTLSALGSALILGTIYVLYRHGNLKLMPQAKWISAGLAVIFFAMPFSLSGSTFADVRVVVAAGLILPAFVTVEPIQVRYGVQSALAVFALANTLNVGWVWWAYKEEYARITASFALIEPGSRILVGDSGDGRDPPDDLTELPIRHAPVLAVHYAKALVPSLLTFPGQQPVELRASVKDFDVLDPSRNNPVPVALLRAIAGGLQSDAIPQHARVWHQRYQYIYLVGTRIPSPMPGLLQEVTGGERFALYRIVTTPPRDLQ